MQIIIKLCLIAVVFILTALVVREFIQVWKRIIRYTAEEKIEELQEQHRQELHKKDQQIKLLEYCCSHPRINVEVWESNYKQEETT